ncbi:P-loop containing nucleoside triphosphate hydrolase protein [Triangularia setosa]|uniref:P-loop containing nucleoside triphosphate hydrolase protein n=1 Tax=Triangularia setosa TaxID=2587417 RepID=A0AAN6WDN1_9PEZI|nr:P-loop containing nucleoside triphosphate hydrolase protein [Podospora setosa]
MMDTIHGSSLDLSSTHRLPTVSAAQALEDFEGTQNHHISTGLSLLDASNGIQKGSVTEIWGPPGVGKTTFGIQLTAKCLREGGGVVWVDGFHRVSIERLHQVVDLNSDDGQIQSLDKFIHYSCPTLVHLIALLCRPTASCIPEGTSLIVIDSLSALVNHDLLKNTDLRQAPQTKHKDTRAPIPAERRIQALHYILSNLQKLAATRNVGIVILTQCATKMQTERGATLVPAINASVWRQGIATRIALFRDGLQDDFETSAALRFAFLQKLNGVDKHVDDVEALCGFHIEAAGLVPVEYDQTSSPLKTMSTPAGAQKRKLGDTGFEIADSEDEGDGDDYGWDLEPDALPPMPSQWQGSEDILLTREPESNTDALDEGVREESDDDKDPESALVVKDSEDDDDQIENNDDDGGKDADKQDNVDHRVS